MSSETKSPVQQQDQNKKMARSKDMKNSRQKRKVIRT